MKNTTISSPKERLIFALDVGAAGRQGMHGRIPEEVKSGLEAGVEVFVTGTVFQSVDNHVWGLSESVERRSGSFVKIDDETAHGLADVRRGV